MTIAAKIVDRESGVILTCSLGLDSKLHYKITTPGGRELDMNLTEWVGVVSVADRWREDS